MTRIFRWVFFLAAVVCFTAFALKAVFGPYPFPAELLVIAACGLTLPLFLMGLGAEDEGTGHDASGATASVTEFTRRSSDSRFRRNYNRGPRR